MQIEKTNWVPKGWGGEEIIVNNNLYCGKILQMKKGLRCSIHYHPKKDETFYINEGQIKLYYFMDVAALEEQLLSYNMATKGLKGSYKKSRDDLFYAAILDIMDCTILSKGDSFHVPPGMAHQMIALEETDLLEFSTTDRPEDSIRIIRGD